MKPLARHRGSPGQRGSASSDGKVPEPGYSDLPALEASRYPWSDAHNTPHDLMPKDKWQLWMRKIAIENVKVSKGQTSHQQSRPEPGQLLAQGWPS